MEQDVLVTKMIGIVVAVIVAAVVLVPVCNSLAEGDGGSGGGGSGGGGEGTVETVYTLGEAYGQVYPDWPYESYQIYNSTVQGSSPFNITTSDIVGVLDNFRSMGIANGFSIVLAQICTDMLNISIAAQVSQNTGGGLQYGAVFDIISMDNQQHYGGNIFDTNSAQNEQQGKQGSFEFVCSSDGAYTLSVTYYDNTEGALTSKSFSGQTGFISFLSESEDGYYELLNPLLSGGLVICPLFEGQDCVVPYNYTHFPEDESEENEYGASVFNGNITLDTDEMKFEVTGLPEGVNVWSGITSTDSGYISTTIQGVNLYSSAEYPYEGEIFASNVYLPTQKVTEGGDGSGGEGGSSDSGSDLGVAGTIIGIIPVFVILAILMGAVGLFYQGRKTI